MKKMKKDTAKVEDREIKEKSPSPFPETKREFLFSQDQKKKILRVLRRLENQSREEFLPSIGPIKAKVLETVIRKNQPLKILEIGTLYGYSAIFMASLIPEEGRVLTIEIDRENAAIAQNNIEEAAFSQKIKIIRGDALKVIPQIKDTFDLLFIDATKREYLQYIQLAEKNLKKGAVVVADNVGLMKDQVRDYLKYVRKSGNYKSQTVKVRLESKVQDAMEISVKKV